REHDDARIDLEDLDASCDLDERDRPPAVAAHDERRMREPGALDRLAHVDLADEGATLRIDGVRSLVEDEHIGAPSEHVLDLAEERLWVLAIQLPRVPHDPGDAAHAEAVELADFAVEEVHAGRARELCELTVPWSDLVVVAEDA